MLYSRVSSWVIFKNLNVSLTVEGISSTAVWVEVFDRQSSACPLSCCFLCCSVQSWHSPSYRPMYLTGCSGPGHRCPSPPLWPYGLTTRRTRITSSGFELQKHEDIEKEGRTGQKDDLSITKYPYSQNNSHKSYFTKTSCGSLMAQWRDRKNS